MTLAQDEIDAGCQIVDGVFDQRETSDLLRSLESAPLTRSRAGARHLMGHPDVRRVGAGPGESPTRAAA